MAASTRSTWGKPSTLVVKEGYLNKKGSILKSWSRKYFMLNKQSLVYFRKEQSLDKGSSKTGLTPQGRIFLSDVASIESESDAGDKKACQFVVLTKKHRVILQASTKEERCGWVEAIQRSLESEGEAEAKDPFRKSLRKLAPGLKRVTLSKDPVKGIGCTIKSAAGHIFVNSIVENGPIAFTGVLRPDDEILDVNGVSVMRMTVSEVGVVIRGCPDEFIATVRPVSALKKHRPHHATNVPHWNYATRMAVFTPPTPPISPPAPHTSSPSPHTSSPTEPPTLHIRPPTPHTSTPTVLHESPPSSPADSIGMRTASPEGSISNDDIMGDYDDEDDEDDMLEK